MAYKLVIEDERIWKKDFARIPQEFTKKILRKIRDLEQEPWPENINVRQLKDYEVADFRLRAGDYRVLFNKDEEEKIIFLLRVLHRSKLY